MRLYADSSFLFSCYLPDANAAEAHRNPQPRHPSYRSGEDSPVECICVVRQSSTGSRDRNRIGERAGSRPLRPIGPALALYHAFRTAALSWSCRALTQGLSCFSVVFTELCPSNTAT